MEMCGVSGEHTTVRCERCNDSEGCVPPANPMPGDICVLCGEGYGNRALAEDSACSADKRIVMDCSGCISAWTVARVCAADEICGPGGMGVQCNKR
jgi:hypothetical protein